MTLHFRQIAAFTLILSLLAPSLGPAALADTSSSSLSSSTYSLPFVSEALQIPDTWEVDPSVSNKDSKVSVLQILRHGLERSTGHTAHEDSHAIPQMAFFTLLARTDGQAFLWSDNRPGYTSPEAVADAVMANPDRFHFRRLTVKYHHWPRIPILVDPRYPDTHKSPEEWGEIIFRSLQIGVPQSELLSWKVLSARQKERGRPLIFLVVKSYNHMVGNCMDNGIIVIHEDLARAPYDIWYSLERTIYAHELGLHEVRNLGPGADEDPLRIHHDMNNLRIFAQDHFPEIRSFLMQFPLLNKQAFDPEPADPQIRGPRLPEELQNFVHLLDAYLLAQNDAAEQMAGTLEKRAMLTYDYPGSGYAYHLPAAWSSLFRIIPPAQLRHPIPLHALVIYRLGEHGMADLRHPYAVLMIYLYQNEPYLWIKTIDRHIYHAHLDSRHEFSASTSFRSMLNDLLLPDSRESAKNLAEHIMSISRPEGIQTLAHGIAGLTYKLPIEHTSPSDQAIEAAKAGGEVTAGLGQRLVVFNYSGLPYHIVTIAEANAQTISSNPFIIVHAQAASGDTPDTLQVIDSHGHAENAAVNALLGYPGDLRLEHFRAFRLLLQELRKCWEFKYRPERFVESIGKFAISGQPNLDLVLVRRLGRAYPREGPANNRLFFIPRGSELFNHVGEPILTDGSLGSPERIESWLSDRPEPGRRIVQGYVLSQQVIEDFADHAILEARVAFNHPETIELRLGRLGQQPLALLLKTFVQKRGPCNINLGTMACLQFFRRLPRDPLGLFSTVLFSQLTPIAIDLIKVHLMAIVWKDGSIPWIMRADEEGPLFDHLVQSHILPDQFDLYTTQEGHIPAGSERFQRLRHTAA